MNKLLRILRFRKDLTQKELANKCGIPVQKISALENGHATIGGMSTRHSVALAKALETTVEELMEDA